MNDAERFLAYDAQRNHPQHRLTPRQLRRLIQKSRGRIQRTTVNGDRNHALLVDGLSDYQRQFGDAVVRRERREGRSHVRGSSPTLVAIDEMRMEDVT